MFSILNEMQGYALTISVYKSRHRKRRILRANKIKIGGLKYNINSWKFELQMIFLVGGCNY